MALGEPVAMSRPIYETEADRANERRVADILLDRWRCTAVKLPRRYEIDYALSRGNRVMAWAEVKCRTNPREQYPTYMVALGKVIAGLDLAQRTNLPFMLVVQWTDSLGWVTPKLDAIHIGGRHDRGDGDDEEPVAHIPITEFKLL